MPHRRDGVEAATNVPLYTLGCLAVLRIIAVLWMLWRYNQLPHAFAYAGDELRQPATYSIACALEALEDERRVPTSKHGADRVQLAGGNLNAFSFPIFKNLVTVEWQPGQHKEMELRLGVAIVDGIGVLIRVNQHLLRERRLDYSHHIPLPCAQFA